jgi:hypothetical protein
MLITTRFQSKQDAHMTFLQDWDAISVAMLKKAPSKKPVLSHYPPSHLADLEKMSKEAASRLCGPVFAGSDLENQIVRLEGAQKYDKVQVETPRFAPFTAAGYFVAHAGTLRIHDAVDEIVHRPIHRFFSINTRAALVLSSAHITCTFLDSYQISYVKFRSTPFCRGSSWVKRLS